MTVQMVENWSFIRGIVDNCMDEPDLPEFVGVIVMVEAVDPVDSYPNLLSQAAGSELPVLFPKQLVENLNLQVGDCICCRVRRAGLQRIFVHREHIEVERPGED